MLYAHASRITQMHLETQSTTYWRWTTSGRTCILDQCHLRLPAATHSHVLHNYIHDAPHLHVRTFTPQLLISKSKKQPSIDRDCSFLRSQEQNVYRTMQCSQSVEVRQMWIAVMSFIYRCSTKTMCTGQAPHCMYSFFLCLCMFPLWSKAKG